MRDRKARVQQLASDIRRAGDGSSHAIKELLALQIEQAKDSLIASGEGAETLRLQGEAQALTRLHELLTVTPVSIVKGDKQ
jgi:hypothetical protein